MTLGRAAGPLPIDAVGELPSHQYIGLFVPAAVACLKVRLAAEGLLTPIWVRRNGPAAGRPWSVVAGRHRLLAAGALGWRSLDAVEVAGPDSDTDELHRLQLAENLDRRPLRPIEQANAIVCRWRQEAAARAWDILSHARDLDEITGQACGEVDARTIRRHRFIHERIIVELPDLFANLNGRPLGAIGSAIKRIADYQDVPTRRRAAEAVVACDDGDMTLDAILEPLGLSRDNGHRNPPATRFLAGFRKMQPVDRRTVFLTLAKEAPPSWLRDAFDADPAKIARPDANRKSKRL